MEAVWFASSSFKLRCCSFHLSQLRSLSGTRFSQMGTQSIFVILTFLLGCFLFGAFCPREGNIGLHSIVLCCNFVLSTQNEKMDSQGCILRTVICSVLAKLHDFFFFKWNAFQQTYLKYFFSRASMQVWDKTQEGWVSPSLKGSGTLRSVVSCEILWSQSVIWVDFHMTALLYGALKCLFI